MATVEALGAYSETCIDSYDMLDLTEGLKAQIKNARSREHIYTPFVPLGEIALGSKDMMVYAGVKNRGRSSITRVAEEMYLGDRLLDHRADLVDALPLFTLPVQDRGRDGGILTEDFTQNGRARLDERREYFRGIRKIRRFDVPEGLYRDVYDALDGHVYNEAFCRMMGWVGHREVLVDFNDVAYTPKSAMAKYTSIAQELVIAI